MKSSSLKSVALILPTQTEIEMFSSALNDCGLSNFTPFNSAEEAFAIASRQHFDIFVTSMELPKMSGIVFIQKLRQTGNYGTEAHLFVCDHIGPDLLALIVDLDLPYVIKRPLDRGAVGKKVTHLLNCESKLSGEEILFRDARAAFVNENFDKATVGVDNVLTLNPGLEKALILKGEILLKVKDIKGAEAVFKDVQLRNPGSLGAAYKLAHIAILDHRPADAAALLTKMADLNPFHVKILEDAGISSFQAEHYDDAKKYMGQLSHLDESNKTASSVIADVMLKLGDYENIIATLEKSHSEKEVIQFLNNAGVKLSKDNDVEGALKMYKAAALQLAGKSPMLYAIYYNMGIAYKRLGDRMNAAVCYKHAIKLNPGFKKAIAALTELQQMAA